MPAVATVKTHTADLATRLVDEAGRILSAEGASALTLRRLASASGTSTMAIYTLFGEKQGLLEGVQRCLDAGVMAANPTDRAAERIAFYLWAVSHGMVSLELAGHLPGEDKERAATYEDALVLAAVPFLPR